MPDIREATRDDVPAIVRLLAADQLGAQREDPTELGDHWRARVEAVRVAADRRGSGLGRRLMQWTIAQAQERGCHLIQLTSNKVRDDAHRFYASLGFEATHEGFKRSL